MKTITIITLCFIALTLSAQETPQLVAFRRDVYKEGWELKFERWSAQRVYMRAWKLDRHEVRSIMTANSPELALFEKGRRNKIIGNTLLNIGIPLTASGIAGPVGLPLLITGIICRANSEDYLRYAVDLHNSNINRPPPFGYELDLYRYRMKTTKYRNFAIMSFCAGGAFLAPGIYYLVKGENLIGAICTMVGTGLIVNGIMFRSVSITYRQKALNGAKIEFDLGFTGNGVGVTAKF